MIQPRKCPNQEALKLLPLFLLLNTAKITQCSLHCLKLLICIKVSGFAWLVELKSHMPPNTQLIWTGTSPGPCLPKGWASLVPKLYAHGPLLRALQALCCADALPAFSSAQLCCSDLVYLLIAYRAVSFQSLIEVVQGSFRCLCMVLQCTSEKLSPHLALQKCQKWWTWSCQWVPFLVFITPAFVCALW